MSHSTVSRALRDSPVVNQETAARIRRIAAQQGYRASAVARSLVTRETRTIGVVVTTIADPFIAGVVAGVERVALERGYAVFLANSNGEPGREIKAVQTFHERRVDGILVESSRVGSQYLRMLSRIRVPIVLINNRYPGQFIRSVLIDNVQGARDATRHLAALGHRRIAYLGDRCGLQSEAERQAGYRQALAEAGLNWNSELVSQADASPQGGAAAAARLMGLRRPPTAIFCYDDMSALGVLHGLHARGLSVPGDVSVVGFDDLFIASYTHPPLTTVRQPTEDMGRQAMEILLRLLAGEECERGIKVPAELVVRQSTAPPRAR